MDISSTIQLIVLVILLSLSAFFSSSETALTTVNRIRMRSLAEEGNKRAARVLQVTDDSAKMLSAILIGNNVVNLTASSLATALALRIFGNAGAGIATGILTVLILIFGEISPKTMATLRAEKISLRFCNIIWLLMKVLTPVIFIINHLAMLVLRLMGVKASEGRQAMTESELRTIVDVSHESGVIESEEKEMINNVFDFGDALAKEVMIPRIDMTFAQVDNTYDEILDIFREDRFTRLPVYEETTDDVIGILNIKDLLLCDREHFSVRELMREPYFTYEHKHTADLLVEMRNSSINIAIVLDEYGSAVGVVTPMDILSAIAGHMGDVATEPDSFRQPDGSWLLPGRMAVDEGLHTLGIQPEEELSCATMAGLLLERLGHIPAAGESLFFWGHLWTVASMDGLRIDQIRIHPQRSGDITEKSE